MPRPKFRIGLRTVKTTLAVILSLFVASLFGELSIFPALASISVMSRTFDEGLKECRNQAVGIFLGGVFGCVTATAFPNPPIWGIGLGILLIMVACASFNVVFSCSLSCAIFIVACMTEEHLVIPNTMIRLFHTAIGLIIGLLINYLIVPYNNSKKIYDLMEELGLHVVDATCPFVKKIHRIVERESNAGKGIIIIGNDKHPEVEGIKGWVAGEATVIETTQEAEAFEAEKDARLCIVSQTTFNYNKFKYLVEIISKKGYDIQSINTICNATEERQTEAKTIAGEVDSMIVIGGSHSSNTQKLFEICKKECDNTFYIQTLEDLDVEKLKDSKCVGITAGASTPNNIIEEVQKHVRIKF